MAGTGYADQLRSKIIAGIHWRDTSESRRVIRQLMLESQEILPTPPTSFFDERERALAESGASLLRVRWDRDCFSIRDLIADGKCPHMGRLVRWAIHSIMVAMVRHQPEQ